MAPIKFLIVGSTLHSDSPGDLDLLVVLPKERFKKEFSLSWPELNKKMNENPTSEVDSYYDKCRGATLILSHIFKKRRIDLKFVPDNLPYGARKEITIDELKTLD